MMQPDQNVGLTTTDVLAIIGAVTGIFGTIAGISALGWDFYKWRYAEKVRLRVDATPGFISTDNPHQRHIHVSVTNIGKIPTTIKCLSLHGFNNQKEKKKRNGQHVSIVMNPAYGQLPVRLNPGDDWFGGFKEDFPGIQEYLNFPIFVVQIEDSMSEFPFRAEVDNSLIQISQ